MINHLRGLPQLSFDALNELYKPCCDHHEFPSLAADDGFEQALAAMIRAVYDQLGIPREGINKTIVEHYGNNLWSGVTEGYGEDLFSVDYETPDYNMLASLQKNVWQFSGAKNYQQLVALSRALVDENGKLRSYSAFKAAAKDINDVFVNQWLKTEYNLAIAGGQMAGKWVDIERDADIMPLLEFDAVLDSQTTELCRGLNGTVLRYDHPFWNTYYPPNHFNCRSTVRQIAGRVQTPDHAIPSADIPEMFRTNLAKQGLIFPKGHAYFDGVPDNVLRDAVTYMPPKPSRNG